MQKKIGYIDSETVTRTINLLDIPNEIIHDTVSVEVHDTITIEKEIEVEKIVEVEMIVEVETPIYIYDDSHSDISLTTGETISLYIIDGMITIENAPIDAEIYVYKTSGELINSKKVKEDRTSFDIPRDETNLIKIGDNSFKVKI